MGLHLQLVRGAHDLWRVCRLPTSIKTQRANKNAIMPDRSDVTMTAPFMDAYVKLLIQTCHK